MVLAACGLACGDTQQASGRAAPPPAAVEAVTVWAEDIRDVVAFTGQLDAEESVVVRPETSGIIASVEFREGQEVEADALLFRLRDDQERAQMAAQHASLVLAERVYERAVALRADGVLSIEAMDRARAELERARALLEVARVALARTEIHAPFDGVLGHRMVSPGDFVQGGGPRDRDGNPTGLVQIDAVASLKLSFSVPERAVPLMRVGMPLEITVTPHPQQRFKGDVYFVAPSLDPRNRRLLVKALVPNPSGRLRPGLSATIHLELGRRAEALVLPEAAITYDAMGTFVWRIDQNGTATRTTVEIGTRQGGRVEILAGLTVGDRVISAGVNKVAPGRPLLITNRVAATP